MARMSHLFELRTGYGNRTHIARLRILSTNRYTNPAFIVFPSLSVLRTTLFVWDYKGRHFFLHSKFFCKNFQKSVNYLMKTKKTAKIRKANAAKWFH